MFEMGFLQLIEWFQSDALRITLVVVLIFSLGRITLRGKISFLRPEHQDSLQMLLFS